MEAGTGTSWQQTAEVVRLDFEGPCALIFLGQAEDGVIVLTEERLESFSRALSELAARQDIAGLVISGASADMFCAGADINVIRELSDVRLGTELARRGQEIFSKLENLPCTTVAAIGGPCVGGGCELVLACDFRVGLNNSRTKIGLPEIRLGILPGFGGTQRLPRLIGLRKALSIILEGKVLSSKRAKAVGLLDELVQPKEDSAKSFQALLERAKEVAMGLKTPSRQKPAALDRILASLGRSIVRSQTLAKLQKATGGHYPAPLRALDAVLDGLKNGTEKGYEDEAKALGELIVTPESKSLVHLYFLSEAAGKLGRSVRDEVKEARIGILGAGVMGAGIAGAFLRSGSPVVLVEPNEEARERARKHIGKFIEARRSFSEEKKQQVLESLMIDDRLKALSKCTLVIEAIIEDVDIKREVFEKIVEDLLPDSIIATNTSSLSVSELSKCVPQSENFIGMHFFNPAEKMPLVEIVQSEHTSERAIAVTAAFTAQLGKYPIVVADVPGFLVNRVLSPYLMEAASILAEGVALESIDSAAKAFGMPMGPFRLLDEVGLDVASKVAESMQKAYGERMQGPNFAPRLVSQGRKGKKSGSGFYRFDGKDEQADPEVRSLLEIEAVNVLSQETITRRLVLAMLAEAVRCLDEGVAGQPGTEAAGQIDLGSVMGFGFPAFRGGILAYADSLGAKEILTQMSDLERKFGKRFEVTEGIKARAEKNLSFYTART